jgi:tetratricopeptide (TPR) repeat protein
MKYCSLVIINVISFFIIGASLSSPWAAEISRDAKRHMYRGQAAMEVAKDVSGFQDAENEFKKAIKYAPDWADAWFNLGVAQEKAENYSGAIESFSKYLKLNPNASDSSEVEGRIYKLEYKQEKAQKANEEKKKDFSGLWTGRASGTSIGDTFTDTFRVESSGNLIRIFMVNSRDSFLYDYNRPGDMLFQLTLSGTRLDGKHMMKREMGDGDCVAITQPPVTGELRDDGKLMILDFVLKYYKRWVHGKGCFGIGIITYQLVLTR